MAEKEKIMVQVVGEDKKTPLSELSRNRSMTNYSMHVNGKDTRCIQGLRHRDTGEIIIPSMYYNIAKSTRTVVWDSSDDKVYARQVYTQDTNNEWDAIEHWLKTTARDSFDNYELVAIYMKDGRFMPYRYGYTYTNTANGRRRSNYHAGIAGIPRDVYNDIKKIVVLQKHFTAPDTNYKVVKEGHMRQPLELKKGTIGSVTVGDDGNIKEI